MADMIIETGIKKPRHPPHNLQRRLRLRQIQKILRRTGNRIQKSPLHQPRLRRKGQGTGGDVDGGAGVRANLIVFIAIN